MVLVLEVCMLSSLRAGPAGRIVLSAACGRREWRALRSFAVRPNYSELVPETGTVAKRAAFSMPCSGKASLWHPDEAKAVWALWRLAKNRSRQVLAQGPPAPEAGGMAGPGGMAGRGGRKRRWGMEEAVFSAGAAALSDPPGVRRGGRRDAAYWSAPVAASAFLHRSHVSGSTPCRSSILRFRTSCTR